MKAYIVYEEKQVGSYGLIPDWFVLLGIFTDKAKATKFYETHEDIFPVYICLGEVPLNKGNIGIKLLARRPYKARKEDSLSEDEPIYKALPTYKGMESEEE